jgi:phosphotransferase system HPr-like phosphotransfer protein
MGLLTLVAAHGVTMTVVCDGDDAEAAVAALAELVGTGFGEGVDP